jgi:hypothetical protein
MLPESDPKSAPKSANADPTQPAAPNDWPSPPAVTIPTDPAFEASQGRQLPDNTFRVDSDRMSPDDDPFNNKVVLTLVELNGNEQLLAPFTTGRQEVWVHYRDAEPHRGYLQCVGDTCPLCRLRNKRTKMCLYPVYDPVKRAVRLLPVSENERPGALLPALRMVLERVMNGERLLIGVCKADRTQFTIESYNWTTSLKEADERINTFKDAVKNGTATIGNLYMRLTVNELAALPDIAESLRLKGLLG